MTPTHECPICHKISYLEPGAPRQCEHSDAEWRKYNAEQFEPEVTPKSRVNGQSEK